MTTKYKVNYRELTNSVTCDISVDSDDMTRDEILKEAKLLFNEAKKFSIDQSMVKAIKNV